jgi:hypothetical protein
VKLKPLRVHGRVVPGSVGQKPSAEELALANNSRADLVAAVLGGELTIAQAAERASVDANIVKGWLRAA